MSNSTRPGGYDERLVVPLEASRRGAHRARTNPLVAALPLLAVVVVVAAVIGVAYALFLRPGGDQAAVDPLTTASSPAATGAVPSTKPDASASPSMTPSSSGASSTAPSPAPVNKNIAISVYNGTNITGLARRVSNALDGAGYTKANFVTAKWGSTVSQTTVFYSNENQQATAAAVVKALGVGKAEMTTKNTGGGLAVVAAGDAADAVP